MRFHLPHIVAIEQPLQLLGRHRDRLLRQVPRPRKLLIPFDDFVPNYKSIAVPPQRLDAVASFANEQKNRARKRILLEHLLNQRRQARPLLPHIDRCAMQVHPLNRLFRSQHARLRSQAPPSRTLAASSRTRSSNRLDAASGTPHQCHSSPSARLEPPQIDPTLATAWQASPHLDAPGSPCSLISN